MNRWIGLVGVVAFCALAGSVHGQIPAFDPNAKLPEKPGVYKFNFKTEFEKKPIQMAYLLYLPKGYDASTALRPALIFLHGAGECGMDLDGVSIHGPTHELQIKERTKFRDSFPMVVICPQCPPRGERWDQPKMFYAVVDLLHFLESKVRVDKSRVYMTGLSMGGKGTWMVGMASANDFAALAPTAADTFLPKDVNRLQGIPAWGLAGADDGGVVVGTQKMINLLSQMGNETWLTIVPHVGHDIWPYAYQSPQFYEWLLAHKRGTVRPLAGQPRTPGHHLRYFETQVDGLPVQLPYTVYIPKSYTPLGKPTPVLLFLHEEDVIGKDINGLCVHGPELAVEQNEALKSSMGMVVISPRMPPAITNEIPSWSKPQITKGLLSLLDTLTKDVGNIDKTRIYVTGLNGGAAGAMQLALAAPQRFAAVAPVFEEGNMGLPPDAAAKLKETPAACFIRESDGGMIQQFKGLIKANAESTVTPIPASKEAGAVPACYANAEFYAWLMKHARTLAHK